MTLHSFVEQRHGNKFTWRNCSEGSFAEQHHLPHEVYLESNDTWLAAKVIRTVAVVCVDTNSDGTPAFQRWQIRKIN